MHAWSGRLIIENGTGAEVNQGLVALADLLMREGVHPEKTTLPYTPGWDLVGVVEEIGKEASQAKVGQMVAARPIQGGYASTSAYHKVTCACQNYIQAQS